MGQLQNVLPKPWLFLRRCGKEELFRLVQGSVESEVTKEIFEEPNVSNNSNDLNNTNMTVNTNDVSVIIIVDSPHKNILSISERLKMGSFV